MVFDNKAKKAKNKPKTKMCPCGLPLFDASIQPTQSAHDHPRFSPLCARPTRRNFLCSSSAMTCQERASCLQHTPNTLEPFCGVKCTPGAWAAACCSSYLAWMHRSVAGPRIDSVASLIETNPRLVKSAGRRQKQFSTSTQPSSSSFTLQ
jgi:hypothetical protein